MRKTRKKRKLKIQTNEDQQLIISPELYRSFQRCPPPDLHQQCLNLIRLRALEQALNFSAGREHASGRVRARSPVPFLPRHGRRQCGPNRALTRAPLGGGAISSPPSRFLAISSKPLQVSPPNLQYPLSQHFYTLC